MFTKDEIDNVINASLCYHEAFLRFVHATMPAEISTKLQINIVLTLHTTGPQSMSTLSRRINVAPEQVTRAMARLRESGIVACEKNPENRRMVIASLTPKGEELLAEHLKRTDERIASYLGQLPEAQARRLIDASATAAEIFLTHDPDSTGRPIPR